MCTCREHDLRIEKPIPGNCPNKHVVIDVAGDRYVIQCTHEGSHLTPCCVCRPPMIIFMVLMGGLLFIGLVMTIIAVWPGYTPVGGNPLKIAGPCLLAFGGEWREQRRGATPAE